MNNLNIIEIIELINNDKMEKAYDILVKELKLNEYIIDNNNLLHICAIRGKEYIYKLLKDKKIDKYLSNSKGENILHLLFRNGFDNMGIEIAKQYPDLLDFVNINKSYPITYCIDRINTLDKVLDLIIKNKYEYQINTPDSYDSNLITKIILKNDKNYLKIINKIEKYIDYNLPKSKPVLITSILNRNISFAEYFIKLEKGIDIPNIVNLYPIHSALNIESEDILNKILQSKKFKPTILDYGGPGNNYLPLNLCLQLIEKYKYKKFINSLELILSKIKNFSQIDMDKNSYGHYALYMKNQINSKNSILIKLLDKIIDKTDKNLKNLDGFSINTIINKKKIDKCKSDNNIKFPDYNFKSNNGLFNSDIIHNMMYFIYILRKYNSSTIPIIKNSQNRNIKVNLILAKLQYQDINYDPYYIGLRELIGIGYELFPELMTSVILWRNKNLYWFDPDFDLSIKNCMISDKRFIIIKVSHFPRPDSLHANVIIFDKDDNSYRRFEPYGYISTDDEMYLDKLVMDTIIKISNKKIKYYKPGDFLQKGRFQTISNDSSIEVRKTGDPNGYCLAWCLWYIELKLNNPSMKEKDLIEKAADKIFTIYCESDTPYIDFIRDYGRKLNDEKDKLFEEFNIDKEHFYNMAYNKTDLDKITNGVTNIINNLL
jgi:hypothetical protein